MENVERSAELVVKCVTRRFASVHINDIKFQSSPAICKAASSVPCVPCFRYFSRRVTVLSLSHSLSLINDQTSNMVITSR